MLLGYGYMRNNLVYLGKYPTHRDVSDMSNLFYFYSVFIWPSGTTRLPWSRLSKRNEMNKNRYIHFSQPAETKIMQMCVYQFKLPNNLFLSRGYEHVSRLARWNRLHTGTKILLCQPPIWIFFQCKHPATMSP